MNILRPLTDVACKFNTRIKIYPHIIKVSCFTKPIFNPDGFETFSYNRERARINKLRGVREVRLRIGNEPRDDSVKRAKDKAYDIAYCNSFDYFVTLTLSSNKVDRYDYKAILRVFKNWLDNTSRRHELKYLIFPELHKDGAVHFHGLVSGHLDMSVSGHKTARGQDIYNLENWTLGYTTAVCLDGDIQRIVNYIMKYITKDNRKIFGNFYFAGGKGLVREAPTQYENIDFSSFDGDYYKIKNAFIGVKYRTDLRE